MKASEKTLGQEIQLFLLRNGYQVEDLAQQMGITAEGLSNLIHGRRRFRDDTLKRMAETDILGQGGLTLQKLKALRAMDEYGFAELIMAVMEYIKKGEIERLPEEFFRHLQEELERGGFPPGLADRKHALLELIQSDPL